MSRDIPVPGWDGSPGRSRTIGPWTTRGWWEARLFQARQETGPASPPYPAEVTGKQTWRVGPIAWGWLLAAAALRLVLHAVVGSGNGFQLDELHFLACGRRPAWGYVDHPALVPWLARMAESLFGPGITPAELRGFSALAGAATVFLAGLVARELGGKRYAQGVAALTVLVMPLFVSTGELFGTVVFDQMAWALAFWLVVRTLRTGAGRGWLLVGLAAGVGLEIKLTMYLFGLGLAVALVATPVGRRHLRTVWPWLAGALAGGLILPNVFWQQAHGWATLEFMHNNNRWTRQEWTPAAFLLAQVVHVGPLAVPLLALGVRWAGSREAVPGARFILWIAGTVGAVLLILQGKPYYLSPVYPALAAAGGVALETWGPRLAERLGRAWTRGLRLGLAAGLVLGALPFAPVTLPILPPDRLADSWALWFNPDLTASVGWPELAAQVAAAVDELSPEEQSRTTILCVSFVEAAAIEQFQPALAARMPVVSPHNTYWLWGPGRRDPQTVILVGARPSARLLDLFGRVQKPRLIRTPAGIDNAPTGRHIIICRDPRQPLRDAWPGLKIYG